MQDPNEGCYNCGSEEDYNGARNNSIRYLCSHCVQGYALACTKQFEAAEEALRLSKPKPKRFNRKSLKLKGATLATC
jgi:hypothetical protein